MGIGKIFIAAIVAVSISAVGIYVNTYNYGNRAETRIKAEHKNLENILGQYSTKIEELVQVPEMYKDDVKEVVEAALKGRYGDGGSKAVFQFLKEVNPTVDVKVYANIQREIAGGREEFKNAQTKFLDIKRGYETQLGYLVTGAILRFQGYPKIDLSQYNITTSDYAVEAFKTGVSKPLKLRSK